MLTVTFQCFRGIGPGAERRLWDAGCVSWDAFERIRRPLLSPAKTAAVRAQILQARAALDAGLADWFLSRLKGADRIRVLPHFLDAVGYLDIETTGLGPGADLTTIALHDGGKTSIFVKGRNLADFLRELPRFRLLVTFNGARFDLPVLRQWFGIDLATPHLDLMHVLAGLGFRGGLKKIESELGLSREADEQITGLDAVVLWTRWRDRGDVDALDQLVRYNARDARGLEKLAVLAYNRVVSDFPVPCPLPLPDADPGRGSAW